MLKLVAAVVVTGKGGGDGLTNSTSARRGSITSEAFDLSELWPPLLLPPFSESVSVERKKPKNKKLEQTRQVLEYNYKEKWLKRGKKQ